LCASVLYFRIKPGISNGEVNHVLRKRYHWCSSRFVLFTETESDWNKEWSKRNQISCHVHLNNEMNVWIHYP
jgi:hypothetical protein